MIPAAKDPSFRLIQTAPGIWEFFNDQGSDNIYHWINAGGFGREGLRMFSQAYMERELLAIGLARDSKTGIVSIVPVSA